jgi:polyphosphate glucokinase
VKVLGIDIGGTGIKGAVVDTKRGVLKTDRLRLLTPHPATPDAVADVVSTLVEHFDWDGPVGCTFPGVIRGGTIHTAANLDPAWIGEPAAARFGKAAGCPVTVLNDADAAGLAEASFGAGAEHQGVVMLLTLGTGIGSALLSDGRLVPNTELGHLPLRGGDAEKYAAELVRENDGLSWEEWGGRVGEYLQLVERLFWPDLFILGGGVSKHAERFLPYVSCQTPVEPAKLHNLAGIVGAALAATTSADEPTDAKGAGKKRKKK